MPAYIPAQNPLGRIDFVPGQRTIRPLPPPGNAIDGRVVEVLTANFAASRQVTTVTLATNPTTGDVGTLTITPTRTAAGSPWADNIPAIPISATVGVTQTIAAFGELIETAAAAITNITSLTDASNWYPLRDFASVTAVNEVITITTRDAGARFTVSWSSTGSTTASTSSTGSTDDELIVGTVAVVTSYTNGMPKIAAPVAGTATTAKIGIVREGPSCSAETSNYDHKVYAAGTDVPWQTSGPCSVYCEGAATVDTAVYYRKTATGTEIPGAIAGSAVVDTPQVITITPTATNSLVYAAQIRVTNFFTGALVTQGEISMTADGSATATEICDGLRTSLVDDNDQLDSIVVGTGTTTLVLTVASPYVATVYFISPGVLAQTETTAAASDHVLITGAKFLETTTAAGIQAIDLP